MTERISRRRLVERATLALGLAAAARLPLAAAQETPEAQKIPQADAHYRNQPNGQQRCGICLQFAAPSHCRIVQGPVQPNGWCQYFAARENAH